jgi:hypothetical protein
MSFVNNFITQYEEDTQVEREVYPSPSEDNFCVIENTPNKTQDVIIGEVGRITNEEVHLFEEAMVNNNIVDNDEGEDDFLKKKKMMRRTYPYSP